MEGYLDCLHGGFGLENEPIFSAKSMKIGEFGPDKPSLNPVSRVQRSRGESFSFNSFQEFKPGKTDPIVDNLLITVEPGKSQPT